MTPNIKPVKDKESPVKAWTGPEGSTRLSFPEFEKIGTESW
jgi:hypothetical protein